MVDTVKKGLTPYRKRSGAYFSGGNSRYLLKNGYNETLAHGDPVRVSAGYVKQADNSNPTTGVFAGVRYVDGVRKQTLDADLWLAGTSSAGMIEGQTDALAYVVDDEDLTYIMKADSSVATNEVGKKFNVTVGTADTVLSRSAAVVDTSASATGGDGMVQVLGFPQIAGTGAGDSETIVEVRLSNPGFASI